MGQELVYTHVTNAHIYIVHIIKSYVHTAYIYIQFHNLNMMPPHNIEMQSTDSTAVAALGEEKGTT